MFQDNKNRVLKNVLTAVVSIIIVVAVAVLSVAVIQYFENVSPNNTNSNVTSSVVSKVDEPKPIVKVSTATVAATGDLLMHSPIFNNALLDDGKYNFDDIFTYFSKYVSNVDYAVANLETTLRGNQDGYKYSGYPQFNCPDSIVDATKTAGFDMLLTANNHAYDTRLKGMMRTLEVVDNKGLDRLGVVKEASEKRYIVKEINNINIGMLCYTYETDDDIDEVSLNGIPLSGDAKGLVNTFNYKELDALYSTLSQQLIQMKLDGAEAIVLFIHWGDEYQITENKQQNEIAQKLCNLGIDVIAGGHPHVVQPVELLTSEEDATHKTVCIYSLGNAVSNQRKERMNLKTGHTEDGVLFSVTFAKYSDGTVVMEKADLLPTWVNMFTRKATGKKIYQIIPLDSSIEDWKTEFDLTDASEDNAKKSYERTMKIVSEGLIQVNDYLGSYENKYPKTDNIGVSIK